MEYSTLRMFEVVNIHSRRGACVEGRPQKLYGAESQSVAFRKEHRAIGKLPTES